MKKLIALTVTLISGLSTQSWAESKFDFKCVSNPPTTSFLLEAKDQMAEITIIHHNGTKYMPIHQGVIVPGDF